MSNPLIFDDQLIKTGNISRFPEVLTTRWFFLLSLWANALTSDTGIIGLRIGNLLIHAGVCGVLLLVGRQWLAIADRDGRLGTLGQAAILGGIFLIAVHPAAVYAVGYLVQRSILLSTLFALATVALHTRGQTDQRPILFVAAAITFAISVLSKEHSAPLPAFLALLTVWLHRNGAGWHWRWTPAFLLYGAISIAITWLNQVAPGDLYEPHTGNLDRVPEHPYLSSVLTQSLFFFRYLALWVVPTTDAMSIDLHTDIPYQIISPLGVGAAGLLFTYALASLWLLAKPGPKGLAGLCAAFPLVMFATEFWAVRLSESFVIYRSYLWMLPVMPGLALLIADGMLSAGTTRPLRKLVLAAAVIGLVFTTMSLDRLDSMSSGLKAWQDAMDKNRNVGSPTVARVYMNLGIEYGKRQQPELAQALYARALSVNPRFSAVYLNLGAMAVQAGDLGTALAHYTAAVEANPDDTTARLIRADVLLRQNQLSGAQTDYETILRRSTTNAMAKNNLAAVWIMQGRNDLARSSLESILADDEAHAVVYFNLALVLAKAGDVQHAREILLTGIEKNPDTPLLEAFLQHLTRSRPDPARWAPRIDPRIRAPIWRNPPSSRPHTENAPPGQAAPDSM